MYRPKQYTLVENIGGLSSGRQVDGRSAIFATTGFHLHLMETAKGLEYFLCLLQL